jgi:hypothetical protein
MSLCGIHRPLQDGQIRLLELNVDIGEDVVGSLHTVDLRSAPFFFALSYVCGTEASNCVISINYRPFSVRPNLLYALKTLKSHFNMENASKIFLWVDAICIDQSDYNEKAQQIGNMHAVFSTAFKVLICLGNVPADVDLVLHVLAWSELYVGLKTKLSPKLLEKLQHDIDSEVTTSWYGTVDKRKLKRIDRLFMVTQRLKTYHKVDTCSLFATNVLLECFKAAKITRRTPVAELRKEVEHVLDTDGLRVSLFPRDHKFWSGSHSLIQLEWFQRVWTFQEIMLARKAMIFNQDVPLVWEIAAAHVDSLLSASDSTELPTVADPTAKTFRKQFKIPFGEPAQLATWNQYTLKSGNTSIWPFCFLLLMTARRRTTVPKDNTYGLLALVRQEVQAEITIAYTKSDTEVLTHAFKVALREEPSSHIANIWAHFESFDQTSALADALPSWCPDLGGRGDVGPLENPNVRYEKLSEAVGEKTAPYACYDYSLAWDTVALKVLKLARIARCMSTACPLVNKEITDEQLASWCVIVQHWLLQLQATFSFAEGPEETLGNNMEDFLHNTSKSRSKTSSATFSASLASLMSHMASAQAWGGIPAKDITGIQDAVGILSAQSKRYLFETSTGQIGFSARKPHVGSHIVLLPGACQLHMLSADCTRYIGCASVSGSMGDALLGVLDEHEHEWVMVWLK